MVNALLVVEVRTPSGHCSCYPPQKYPPQTLLPENVLEEIYYHQVNPPQGFVFQRVYTDDRRIDQAMAVENNDLVTVPRGHQPVCVPYGHESYYLNVMAGPKRAGQFHDHAPYDGQHDL
jgi:5-deoxy-glucuronate isomerase